MHLLQSSFNAVLYSFLYKIVFLSILWSLWWQRLHPSLLACSIFKLRIWNGPDYHLVLRRRKKNQRTYIFILRLFHSLGSSRHWALSQRKYQATFKTYPHSSSSSQSPDRSLLIRHIISVIMEIWRIIKWGEIFHFLPPPGDMESMTIRSHIMNKTLLQAGDGPIPVSVAQGHRLRISCWPLTKSHTPTTIKVWMVAMPSSQGSHPPWWRLWASGGLSHRGPWRRKI